MSLEAAEAKWARKTAKAFREKWLRNVQAAGTYQAYIKGISLATGIPEGTVSSSLAAQSYKEFQANAGQAVEKAMVKLASAASQRKWSTNYRRAFGG